jgi:hypothetical protein
VGRAQGARTRAPRLPPPSPRTGRPAALGRPPARDFTILSPCPPTGGVRRPCIELVCIYMTPRTPKLLRCRELERKHPVVRRPRNQVTTRRTEFQSTTQP